MQAIEWDRRDARGVLAAPGVYFVRVDLADEARIAKVVVVR